MKNYRTPMILLLSLDTTDIIATSGDDQPGNPYFVSGQGLDDGTKLSWGQLG